MVQEHRAKVPLTLTIVLLVLLQAPVVKFQEVVGNSEQDVDLLTEGKPLIGFLDANEARVFRFGVTKADTETFPDVLISLIITNPRGDADILCMPYTWVLEGRRTFPWHSTHRTGPDEVFLSSRAEEFLASITNVTITRNGKKDTIQAAGFQCWIVGASRAGSSFELEADVSYGGVELIGEEQDALREIYDICCATPGSCDYWPTELGESAIRQKRGSKTPLFEWCHVHGNTCGQDGRLTRLNLDHIGLECDFPSEIVQKFVELRKLEAAGNRFTGDVARIMDVLATLQNLTHINVERNRLTGDLSASEGLCRMAASGLQYFDVQVNHITGIIPPCLIAAGSKLLDIILSRTDIEGTIPDIFDVSSSLQALIISNTQVSGTIPATLVNLKELTYIGLAHNLLTGTVPEGLDTLPHIHTLGFRDNRLSGLPASWSNPGKEMSESLKFIDFGHNKLGGEFPLALATHSNLDVLDLSKNKMKGSLPDMPGVFRNITFLKLSNNKFSGSIPHTWEDMGMFKHADRLLGRLDLRSNKGLTGELPEFFYPEQLEINVPEVFLEKTRITCNFRGKSPYVLDLEGCNGHPTVAGD